MLTSIMLLSRGKSQNGEDDVVAVAFGLAVAAKTVLLCEKASLYL